MANTGETKQGEEWARQHPNQPAPRNASQDFRNAVERYNQQNQEK